MGAAFPLLICDRNATGKDELHKFVCSQHMTFIVQLEEHFRANVEAMGSKPVEALKFFSG